MKKNGLQKLSLTALAFLLAVPLVVQASGLLIHRDEAVAEVQRADSQAGWLRTLLQASQPSKTSSNSKNKTVLVPNSASGSVPVAVVVPANAERPLAVESRPDPLDSLHDYKGGYNLKDKHYWGSVVWTGAWGYIAGVAWLLLGLLLALLGCFYLCCCRHHGKSDSYHGRAYYWLPAILTILASLVVIAGTIAVFVGNGNFYDDAKGIKDYVLLAADNTTADARYVASTLQGVQPVVATIDQSQASSLTDAIQQLDSSANDVDQAVAGNTDNINRGLKAFEVLLIVLAVIQLVAGVAAIIAVLFKWPSFIISTLLWSWVFCACALILSGLFFFVHHFVTDTCTAMREYSENPYNTTLDDILPCVDLLTAQNSLRQARTATNNLLNKLNNYINTANRLYNTVPALPNINIPTICLPYGSAPDYPVLNTCPANTVPISQINQTFSKYRCSSSNTVQCLTALTPLTPDLYNQSVVYAAAAANVTAIMPIMEGLANCSFVFNTFNYLSGTSCSPTRSHVQVIWIGFLVAGIGLGLLSLLLALLAPRAHAIKREKKYRLEGADVKDQAVPNNQYPVPAYNSAPSTSGKGLLSQHSAVGAHPTAPPYSYA